MVDVNPDVDAEKDVDVDVEESINIIGTSQWEN